MEKKSKKTKQKFCPFTKHGCRNDCALKVVNEQHGRNKDACAFAWMGLKAAHQSVPTSRIVINK